MNLFEYLTQNPALYSLAFEIAEKHGEGEMEDRLGRMIEEFLSHDQLEGQDVRDCSLRLAFRRIVDRIEYRDNDWEVRDVPGHLGDETYKVASIPGLGGLAFSSYTYCHQREECEEALRFLVEAVNEKRSQRHQDKINKLVGIIHGLADQQAMDDDWWEKELAKVLGE